MPLEAGSRLGCYEIIALIGAGGMGEVYRARDTKLDRDVAIKVWVRKGQGVVRCTKWSSPEVSRSRCK